MRVDEGDDFIVKYISPEKLAQLLTQVPPGCVLKVNGVGNIWIGDAGRGYLGYIDLGEETVEWSTTAEDLYDEPGPPKTV